MICTIDVGNTKAKIFLFDENLNVVEKKTWSTPDLFEPERWDYLFNTLYTLNSLFFIADLRISCVSWRAFLALRVYLKYDMPNEFKTDRAFNPDLMILPPSSPIIIESSIPVKKDYVSGLVGADRLLAAYASFQIFQKTCAVVSLGTATTIDVITNAGVFLSGAILPGIDVSYQGLLNRATSLPNISELKDSGDVVSNTSAEALYNGVFRGQGILISGYITNMLESIQLSGDVEVIITGGRAQSVSKHIDMPHLTTDGLVNYGLALVPDWKSELLKPKISPKKISSLAKRLEKENFLKSKDIGV